MRGDGLGEELARLRGGAVGVAHVEVDDGGAGVAAARGLVGDLGRGDGQPAASAARVVSAPTMAAVRISSALGGVTMTWGGGVMIGPRLGQRGQRRARAPRARAGRGAGGAADPSGTTQVPRARQTTTGSAKASAAEAAAPGSRRLAMTLRASKRHGARGVADPGDDAGRLDVVAGPHGREELDRLVRAEEPLVAVEADEQLGGDVAEEGEHARAVDELARVVCVVRAHPDAQGYGETNAVVHAGTTSCQSTRAAASTGRNPNLLRSSLRVSRHPAPSVLL